MVSLVPFVTRLRYALGGPIKLFGSSERAITRASGSRCGAAYPGRRSCLTPDTLSYGPYHSRAEAMLFAIDAAQKLGEQGENTQVGLMGEHGRFRAEWSYG